MSHTEIFPVGIKDEKARANFDQRVRNPVPKSEYEKYTHRDLGDHIPVWGYRDKGKGTWKQLSEGDYLLFYPGEFEYKYAARILGTEHNPKLGNSLFDTPDQVFEYIVYLDSLYEISLDSEILHEEYAGYKIGHPVRSQSFSDKAYTEILNRYDSVEDYIEAHLTDTGASLTGGSGRGSGAIKKSNKASVDRDEQASDLSPPKKEYTVARTIRNTTIAKELKDLYDHRCQVCGKRRERNSTGYAEAHHIHPLGDEPPGPDTKENILVLCPNHHADFDFGMLEVDPESLTVSHEYDESVDDDTLRVKSDHKINPLHLEYHNENQ